MFPRLFHPGIPTTLWFGAEGKDVGKGSRETGAAGKSGNVSGASSVGFGELRLRKRGKIIGIFEVLPGVTPEFPAGEGTVSPGIPPRSQTSSERRLRDQRVGNGSALGSSGNRGGI